MLLYYTYEISKLRDLFLPRCGGTRRASEIIYGVVKRCKQPVIPFGNHRLFT